MPHNEKISIFWFRRDLRLFDNTALSAALQENKPVVPIFIFDRQILDGLEDKSDARLEFIHDKVVEIQSRLQEMGSSLLVFYGDPVEVFGKLVSTYNINAVYTNRDYEPYANKRDDKIAAYLQSAGIPFRRFKDQVIFEHREITKEDGEPYRMFTPYKRRWLQVFRSQRPEIVDTDIYDTGFLSCDPTPVPSLEELGFVKNPIKIPPADFNQKIIENYHQTREYPAIEGTSRLGIHLRHGTISIRQAVKLARDLNDTWLNELIWREFYMMILSNYPQVVNHAFKPAYDKVPWINDPQQFNKWCTGTTGYPIVDAGMRELNATGYMHNRVRMITASFLTKHLLIDWRWGESYFATKLLDYELSSNNGGWQWAAGTGTDAQPYFRVFNPWSQAEKFDPDQVYIKKWVTELDGSDYPSPVVDHKAARQRAIKTYKQAVS
jgi:deoxyribodipyrimidine photo-lyase